MEDKTCFMAYSISQWGECQVNYAQGSDLTPLKFGS